MQGAPSLRINTGAEGEIKRQEQHEANCLSRVYMLAEFAAGGGAGVMPGAYWITRDD